MTRTHSAARPPLPLPVAGPHTRSAPRSRTTPTISAGGTETFTVTAYHPNKTIDTSYTGTGAITSTDPKATLPAAAQLTEGVGTFTVTLETAGTQTITASDTADPTLTLTTGAIAVSPGPVTQYVVNHTPAAGGDDAGDTLSFTITAEDAYGNIATADAAAFTGSRSPACPRPGRASSTRRS